MLQNDPHDKLEAIHEACKTYLNVSFLPELTVARGTQGGQGVAIRRHSRLCPTSPGMTAFNTTRTLRRMFNGTAYLDRAAPRLAAPKFLVLAFTRGPFIELAPGSNCPGRIFGPGRSAAASRFLTFCDAFAFARWRALALVMSSSPF
jgi:hypothetical protein